MAPAGASSFPSLHSCTFRSCNPVKGCPQSAGSRAHRFRSWSIRPTDIGSAFPWCIRSAFPCCCSIDNAKRCIFPISSYLLPLFNSSSCFLNFSFSSLSNVSLLFSVLMQCCSNIWLPAIHEGWAGFIQWLAALTLYSIS